MGVLLLVQMSCVAHYRMSAEETAHLDGFDARNEHLLTPAAPGDSVHTASGFGPAYLIPEKPYRLFHRTGYSVGFNSSTELAFVLSDQRVTDSTQWRSIKRGAVWTATPMKPAHPAVTFSNADLAGSVVSVPSPGRTVALLSSIAVIGGGVLVGVGLIPQDGDRNTAAAAVSPTSNAALLPSGIALATAGLLGIIASGFIGWNLGSDPAVPSRETAPEVTPPPRVAPAPPADPVPEFKPPL